MSKKFWTFVISFWLAILIAGFASYKYIDQLHEEDRQELIFNYVYAEDEDNSKDLQKQYAVVQYEADAIVAKLNTMQSELSKLEAAITSNLSITDEDKKVQALSQSIEAYQAAKNYVPLFANVEILNSSLLQRKQLEKLADAAYTYAQANASYFVICANMLKTRKRDNIENDFKAVQENLKHTKDSFTKLFQTYSN